MKLLQLGGGAPGDLPITMTPKMQLGGHVPGELPITMCQRPSQGDARLTALAAKLPLGAPLPAPAIANGPGMLAIGDAAAPPPALAIGDAAVPPHALADAERTDATAGAFGPGAVSSGTPKGNSKVAAMTAKIMAARLGMKDERAEALWALWACMYL
jgi:hypothetical protein